MKSLHDPSPRTWNGARWFFVLLFMLLAGVCAWLIFHGALMEHPAAPLLVIPAAMSFGALGIALFASDKALQRILTSLLGFS